MKMSDSTDKIFAALSKMQSELTNASKAKQGHGYKYADLAECIETARTPLADNGLAVSQLMGNAEGGTTLITMLTHSSGQYISSEFTMKEAVLQGGAGKNPAQAMGASITYMRRYAFAAIIGLAQEDDDAKDVRERKQQMNYNPADDIAKAQSIHSEKELVAFWNSLPAHAQNNERLKNVLTSVKQEIAAQKQQEQEKPVEMITDPQRKLIRAHYGETKLNDELRKQDMATRLGLSNPISTTELTKQMAHDLIESFNRG